MAEAVHIHLLLNHIPVIGLFLGLVILLVGWMRKNPTIERTGFLLIAFTGLLVIPTYLSGEGAEELLEHFSGIDKEWIETHEEAAEGSLWVTLVASALSGAAFFLSVKAHRLFGSIRWGVLLVGLVALVSLARTANHGGNIRHPEIRPDNAEQNYEEEPEEVEVGTL